MSSQLTPIPRLVHEERIRKACPILHPTGCTPHFCNSGRMNRPQEPKVGVNRSILTIKAEAQAFLQEMFDEGLFASRTNFEQRLEEVNVEIVSGAVHTQVWEDRRVNVEGSMQVKEVECGGISSAGWTQTREELEWGIRTAWRNSRKCIMRANHMDLKLIDLRHISTSRGMVDAIIEHLPSAYNGGRIQPTVFLFPPRPVNGTGAMFWSPQLLTFAGYSLPNGKTLGDPANIQITKDIMELGWIPPEPKSRWDILPVVAMAENDEPAWGILPREFTELVEIRHPRYAQSFERMGLKWCKFPALSRLGFDIGGVQYTASPFVGWFMDAEIGVRDLADSFRYNVLPEVIEAIGWKKKDMEFVDLPDHERLLWMSKAQTELNYAVQCSFMQVGVTCTSTLTASKSWCAFDDQHLEQKGYRLNSDPYWIAPPQGSIIPLWHRGSAPNYQPKPLVAKHRFDPVKVWKRRGGGVLAKKTQQLEKQSDPQVKHTEAPANTLRVHILHSGTLCTALTLAERLRLDIQKRPRSITLAHFGTLNSISPSKIRPGDTLLLLISTTGLGQVPTNGQNFTAKNSELRSQLQNLPLRFAVFGIGDSGYNSTFNGGAVTVTALLLELGAKPLISNGLVKADVAIESPPLSSFNSWWEMVSHQLLRSPELPPLSGIQTQHDLTYQKSYKQAIISFNPDNHKPGKVMKLELEVYEKYKAMSHIRLLPQNNPDCVARIISLLGIQDSNTPFPIPSATDTSPSPSKTNPEITIHDFLTSYVDPHQPFLTLEWASTNYPDLKISNPTSTSALQVLNTLFSPTAIAPPPVLFHQILLSLPPQRPRTYSIASYTSHLTISGAYLASILLKTLPSGKLSFQTLTNVQPGSRIRYKLSPCDLNLPLLKLGDQGIPIVAVTFGTGFAAINSLLSKWMSDIVETDIDTDTEFPMSPRTNSFSSSTSTLNSSISNTKEKNKLTLFHTFKPCDETTFTSLISTAEKYDLFDGVYLLSTTSSPNTSPTSTSPTRDQFSHSHPQQQKQAQIQDQFQAHKEDLVRKLGPEKGWLYMCGKPRMVEDVKRGMEECVGEEVWGELVGKGRVLEEVF